MCQKRNPQHRYSATEEVAFISASSARTWISAWSSASSWWRRRRSFPNPPGVRSRRATRRPRITAGAAWSWKGGSWQAMHSAHRQKRPFLEGMDGKFVCLLIKRGEAATARRTGCQSQTPRSRRDGPDQCAIQIRKSLVEASQRTRNQP
jgi:hypothetical protein